MSLPKRKENLPSRSEIATLAAVLLGASRSPGAGGEYSPAKARDICGACRDALSLIETAHKAAEAITEGGELGAGFEALDEYEEFVTAYEEEEERAKNPGAELPPDIREQVRAAGWDGGSLGPDDRLPWGEFFSRFMLPKKPSEKREERFRSWLNDRLRASPRLFDLRMSGIKGLGIARQMFISYLKTYPAWWEAEKSRINRKGGDARAQKLLEQKEKAQKEEERKRLAQIQNGTAAGDVGKKKAPKKKTKKKPSA
jgi:hypothetical protein